MVMHSSESKHQKDSLIKVEADHAALVGERDMLYEKLQKMESESSHLRASANDAITFKAECMRLQGDVSGM